MAMAAPQGQSEHEHGHQHGHQSEPNISSHTDPGAAATSSIIATNRWGPYSGNMAVILAALLTALALALALKAVVRYLLGGSRQARRGRAGSVSGQRDRDSDDPEKPAVEAPPPPALLYSVAGTKLAGAAAECAICLAEFVDGDAVRVMPACRHGFHARCIKRWLAGGRHSSCPTCRAPAVIAATRSPAVAAQPEAAGPSSS